MTNLAEIKLESILGKTRETRILDLIVPLKEGTVFTNKEVITALSSTGMQIDPILKGMVESGFLVQSGSKTGRYIVNPKSNRVWAIRNLLVAMYSDQAHTNSMKRLGRKE
jgi:hypothetical protein